VPVHTVADNPSGIDEPSAADYPTLESERPAKRAVRRLKRERVLQPPEKHSPG